MTIIDYLNHSFPEFSNELKQEIILFGRLKHFHEKDVIVGIGDQFSSIPLIMEGSLKVSREDDKGNELFLYYLMPGQTCALSLNCLILSKPSEVLAVAEEETTLLVIPSEKIGHWMSEHADWREFVLKTHQMRFHEMLSTIDGLAFTQLDKRVMDYLTEKSKIRNSDTIHLTHQEIANDLNSTREVISRILKILEKRGDIELKRNEVRLM